MGTDPWFWTVSEVAAFFRQDAARYIRDMPNGRLPDLMRFLENLEANDVSGAVLLTAVDASFLRGDCGLVSLGVRSSVLHCIQKLRQQSTALNQPNVSTPQSALPEIPLSGQSHGESSGGEGNGLNVRTGELQIQDAKGRKRRKLDLAKIELAAKVSPTVKRTGETVYFGNSSLPVDDLFFGKTPLGQVIDTLEPQGDILIMDNDRDIAEDNFQFQQQDKPAGECHYVYSQMRHFFQNDEVVELQRHSRPALALLPYRETLISQQKPRCATVIQIWENTSEAVAVKENSAFLNSNFDYNNLNQSSATAEWDFLISNHGGDEELPAYMGSQEDHDITSSLADEIEEELEEREREASKVLERSKVVDIIEQEIDSFIEDWQKGLPRHEEKNAWKVWKKMKSSKSLREALIDDANVRITRLNARLKKYQDNFLLDEWRSEKDLKSTCEVLRASVDDREERLWMKSVWQRKQEPQHVVQRGHGTAATANGPAHPNGLGFVAPPEDRIFLSPKAAFDLDRSMTNGGDEELSAPSDLPGDTFGGADESFDASAEASEDSDQDSRAVGLDARSTFEGEHLAVAKASPFTEAAANGQKFQDATIPDPPEGKASDSESLSDVPLSSFQKRKVGKPLETSTPITPSKNIIVLSSDSTTSSKRRQKWKMTKTRTPYSGNPNEATTSEIELWDVNELASRGDRLRILIKLLTQAGKEFRDRLYECHHEWRRAKFRNQLSFALEVLSGLKTKKTAGLEEKHSETMLQCARIAIAWLLSNPRLIEDSLDEVPWNIVFEDGFQFCLLTDQLATILSKRDARMFANQVIVTPKKNLPSTPLAISSDDDTDIANFVSNTPHKNRKKKVAFSAAAAESRNKALERQERFKSALESQSSDPQPLAAMVDNQPSVSNVPINPAKSDDQEYVYIYEKIAKAMKSHQIDGTRFMWRELTATEDDASQGCILAHTMGLGKTLQAIALLIAMNEAAQSHDPKVFRQLPKQLRPKGIRGVRQLRTLVLSPPALLHNWCREIDTWAPHALGHLFVLDAVTRKGHDDTIEDWHRVGGVLLVGYEMFRRRALPSKKNPTTVRDEHIAKIMLEGPEIVVADEVHQLKNQTSKVSIATSQLRTESRIGLTGTPMSNNVQEIYALISFVAPGYLGEPTEFRAHFAEPIGQGTWQDSTSYEIRKSIKKLAVLQHDIQPKVNRADITVLRGSLKAKVEFVITVPLTSMQLSVYKKYVATVVGGDGKAEANLVTIFGWLAVLTLLTNHPLAFKHKLLTPPPPPPPSKLKKKLPLNEETSGASDSGIATPADPTLAEPTPAAIALREEAEIQNSGDQHVSALGLTEQMVQDLIAEIGDDVNAKLSAKVSIFINILEHSKRCGDKVLVFSSSIPTLNYLGDLLTAMKTPFGRIDGQVEVNRRLLVVDDFNEDRSNVMIISTKAGGTGLNIQAANRVVIFDFGFNPAWEEQAIGRSYRLGQTKPVFVYRFVAGGTFEENIYNKQLFKSSLAQRVVDKKTPRRNAARKTRDWLYEPTQVKQQDLTPWIGKDPDVLDPILARHTLGTDTLIRALSTMETLQEDAKDAPLTEEERKEVNEEIQLGRTRAKTRRAGMASTSAVPRMTTISSTAPSATSPSRLSEFRAVSQPQPQPPTPRAAEPIPHHVRSVDQDFMGPSASFQNTTLQQPGPLHGHPTQRLSP